MNRIQAKPSGAASKIALDLNWCGAGTIHDSDENSPHAIFAPLHYEANYAYPLLVWLHGGGDNEHQLRRIMPVVSLRNYVAVAPRGTLAAPRNNGAGNGYRWVQTAEHVAQAEQRIGQAIAAANDRFHVRADRIFLAGFESGGTMAFRIAMENPSQFAGVVSLCGPFPQQGTPLAALNAVRQLPLFVAACRQGQHYPTEQVCDNLRLLHSAGMSITLREYPGNDGLTPQMLADIDRWIMEQIALPPAILVGETRRQSEVG